MRAALVTVLLLATMMAGCGVDGVPERPNGESVDFEGLN